MTEYAFKRVFNQTVGCPLAKYVLYLLAYCPNFSYHSLAQDSELSPEQLEEALDYLLDKRLIKFRQGTCQSLDGLVYQVEILF